MKFEPAARKFKPAANFEFKWILLTVLPWLLIPVTYLVLTYPPVIASQGIAHRIFYFHVPIAWVALYAPILATVFAVLYLMRRKEIYDIWSIASIRVSLLFSLAVVISGPLWAKTEWGTYWNWKDARLITFFILLVLIISYFSVRQIGENIEKKATQGSVMTILISVASLMTWFSIRWFATDTHPGPVVDTLSTKIRMSFWVSVLAYHFLFLTLLFLAVRLELITRWLRKIEADKFLEMDERI